MIFNWLVIIGLVIGFILLLGLFKHFFYQPIIDNLNAREQKLQQLLSVANNKIKHAKTLQQNCEKAYQDLEKQKVLLLKKSQIDAEQTNLNLLKSAHEAADDMLRKRLGAIQNELQTLQQWVITQNITEVYAITEQMLTDLMGVELHEVMFSRFIDRVNTLPEEQQVSLLQALKRSNNLVVIRSAHALSEQNKQKISDSLSRVLDNKYPIDIKFNFILVPNFIAGLEINVSGWKLQWSIHQHLQSLQDNVRTALQLDPLPDLDKSKSPMTSFIVPSHKKGIEA
jgi:F-type H+-transporting ATPase subunit b